jgi:hypothetical protein
VRVSILDQVPLTEHTPTPAEALDPASKVIEVMGTRARAHGNRVDTGVGRAALDNPAYGDKEERAHALADAMTERYAE